MTLFKRVARVDVETSDSSRITLRGLRIIFKVEKVEDKEPNKLDLEIFNLSQDTRNQLRDTAKNISLFAGYRDENGEELVFTGDITSVSHVIARPDVVTTITAQDGKVSIDKAKLSISLEEKASASNALQRVLGAFNIGNNLNQITFDDKTYETGFSFVGSAKMALDKVTGFLNLSWSVQNNLIVLVPFDGDDNTGAIFLSPTTGLIGSPERIAGETRKAKNKSKKVTPGWAVTSLLLPAINPLNRIAVQSAEIPERTQFTVTNVVHVGDTFGSDWSTRIEVKE